MPGGQGLRPGQGWGMRRGAGVRAGQRRRGWADAAPWGREAGPRATVLCVHAEECKGCLELGHGVNGGPLNPFASLFQAAGELRKR